MHDIDRIRLESQSETGMFEAGPFEAAQFEFAQAETPYGETGEVFGETEEMELASEFLDITSEAELDRFLGGLIERAGRTIGKFVKSPEGQAIGGMLKGAAKQVLPGIGSAVGGYFGGPTGAKLGGDVASAAGRAFGLELEGLSSEDREFEVARRYVSFAGEAVKKLASAPSGLDPRTAANAAAVAAAKTHAPGLLSPRQAGMEPQSYSPFPTGHSGRWMRRGSKIVLYGI
ncbi:MAG: hypothetical protein L0Z50_18615 [Verrucomicrobiales bacterium]|nr:hypothetical protein [Verrucomicrobiales bacterium]